MIREFSIFYIKFLILRKSDCLVTGNDFGDFSAMAKFSKLRYWHLLSSRVYLCVALCNFRGLGFILKRSLRSPENIANS